MQTIARIFFASNTLAYPPLTKYSLCISYFLLNSDNGISLESPMRYNQLAVKICGVKVAGWLNVIANIYIN
jgi:hypothetical protein